MDYMKTPVDPQAEGSFPDRGFKERRDWFHRAYAPRILELLATGRPICRTPVRGDPDVRSWVWNAQILFAVGEDRAANEILRRAELYPCEFMPMLQTQILTQYGTRLDADVAAKAEAYVRDMLPRAASERIHPSMYNDNFGNMAMYVLLVAGTRFGLSEYVSLGHARLEALCDQFRRCGSVMEYGSPTYSPVNLVVLAELVNHAPDADSRAKALRCEERLWVEAVTHYHAESGRMAGPYSRAYYVDTVGHTHLSAGLFWAVLGDSAFINPKNDWAPLRPGIVLHYSLDALMMPNMGWQLHTEYHLPEHLYQLALHKQYPFETEFMTECIPSDGLAYVEPDLPFCFYGGHRSPVYTWMTAEYAMGSAQNQYHEGAISESFHITCRNKDKAHGLPDTNVLYSRFVFNEKQPGQSNHYAYYGMSDLCNWREEGRKLCLQKRNVALVAYKPKLLEREHVSSARMSLMIPTHLGDAIDLWVGDKPVTDFSEESDTPETVFVRIHKSFFAFIPLHITDLGRRKAMKVEKSHDHVQISWYLYEGADRSFEAETLINAQAGFVCIAGTEAEFGTLETFMSHANATDVEDRMEQSAKMWSHRIKVHTPDTELFFIYNPLTEAVITATADKRPVGMHVFRSDMLVPEQIPYLND